MEGFLAEMIPNGSNVPAANHELIDLTLKLSTCGQSAEEKSLTLTLTRSSSMAREKGKKSNVGNGVQEEGPIVACMESSSDDEKGLMRFGDIQAMRRVKTGRRMMLQKRCRAVAAAAAAKGNPYGGSFHHGGGSSNAQTSPDEDADNPVKKLKAANPRLRDDTMEILRKMPTVTTTGDGPNGRRIKGVLYNYEKGEVCILCVCHASFHSPSEFVMHAGGKEVENPMKLITSYWQITSDRYFDYIKKYVVGIGPWKNTVVVPVGNNYLQTPTDLVAKVHPYTYRNENHFLHFNFNQEPYEEYDYWINKIGVDGLYLLTSQEVFIIFRNGPFLNDSDD